MAFSQDGIIRLPVDIVSNDTLSSIELHADGRSRRQLSKTGNAIFHFISFLIMLIALPQSVSASFASSGLELPLSSHVLSGRASNQTSPLLRCIEVSPPVSSPASSSLTQTLMVHTFGNSYGQPFIGSYTPPNIDFNRVTFNFTVTSAGRQYDRLALMYFNDTEIWRTSTAEPTQTGIIWTYIKDMSNYRSLFKEPQKIIFDLGNIVDDTYTGYWYTTLTATFFTASDSVDAADIIIPVSARQSAANGASAFTVPDQNATNLLTLPQNAKKAVFTISACGQATEEFWWSNVLSSDTTVFGNDSTLYGYSPFRELQLYIDGMLAGVAWPFPVIFTGGVVPGFWRPVVGIDAFDLREDEIDITAFLPLLSDGKTHTFEIRVAGINDDGKGNGQLSNTVGSNWVVTGKVFLWLDSEGSITKGTTPIITAPYPSLSLSSSVQRSSNRTVMALNYSVNVARSFSLTSTLQTSSGSQIVTWQQNLTYSNDGSFTNGGNDQLNKQTTSGSDISSNKYSKASEYPLWVYSTYNVLSGGNFTIDGKMARGKNVRRIGELAFPSELQTFDYGSSYSGTTSNNWQNGTASYLGAPALKLSFGSGTTEQYYSLAGVSDAAATDEGDPYDPQVQEGSTLYRRHVLASNNSIILDEESTLDSQAHYNTYPRQFADKQTFAKLGIKAMLGRGPF